MVISENPCEKQKQGAPDTGKAGEGELTPVGTD